MVRPVRKSLSRRAALYVATICAVIVGLEAWREWNSHEVALQKAQLEAHNLASSLRQHAEDTYEIAEQAVSSVTFQMETAAFGSPLALTRNLMARTMTATPRLRSLAVYDERGHQLLTTDRIASADQGKLQYFLNHKNSVSRAPFFGSPIAASNGGVVLPISQRFNKPDGSFGGVVVGQLDTRYFSDFYRTFDVGQHGSISLMSAGGIVLSRMPIIGGLIGSNLRDAPLFRQQLAVRNTGTFSVVSRIDGVERIAGFDKSFRYPIVAVVAVSRNEALAAWWQAAVPRVAVTIGLVFGIALLGLRLADQIRRRQISEDVLEQKEAEFRLLAESASDLVERLDRDGNRIYISPALERLTGYLPSEMLGQNAFEVIHEDDRANVMAAAERLREGITEQETITFRTFHKDGHVLWLETSLRITADREGPDAGVVCVTRDISDRKRLEIELESMALRDGLTGIANRRAFDDALEREVGRARRTAAPLSLLMIDADWFKRFNDDYGHLAGDACLRSIAAIVSAAARRPADLAARYGGEEMALLLPETSLSEARLIGAELCRHVEALRIPHQRNLPWKVATISIGVATIDVRDEGTVPEGAWLVSTADLALYDAKAQGRNQCIAAPGRSRARLVG